MMSTPRAAAPDIARGLALGLIALANATWWSSGHDSTTWWDRAAELVRAGALEQRVYPLFVMLMGYGITQFLAGQREGTRRAIMIRSVLLVALGLAHGVLLWQGDVLAAYGLLAILAVWWAVPRSSRTLWLFLALAGGSSLVVALTVAMVPVSPGDGLPTDWVLLTSTDGLIALQARVVYWLLNSALSPFMPTIVLPLVLGIVAARYRVLEEPERYLRTLRLVSLAVPVGWTLGVFDELAGLQQLWLMDTLAGMVTALGYAAMIALLSRHAQLPALQALGRSSLSGYLAQSAVLVPVLAPWALGASAQLGPAAVMGVGVLTWMITLIWAHARSTTTRGRHRGPFEKMLRRAMW
ncbi:uncharacterized protein YxaH-like [Tenebrio molitor]|uniref:uncharacterized protein YxaH-like n=1 Tax=Tenebrio molitor TaxID=7067 RepID=UPI0036246ED3